MKKKIYSFFAFVFKVCKKCCYDPKIFIFTNIYMGIKKTQNFMLISNSLMPSFKNVPVRAYLICRMSSFLTYLLFAKY
jgi:hypothetical protein